MFDYKVVEKLYNGLIKDLHHSTEPNYVISDGYDYVQIAICFLLQFKGRYVHETCSNDKKGKPVSIKTACYRHVDSHLMKFRRKNAQQRQIDFTNNKEMLVDPIDCFDNPILTSQTILCSNKCKTLFLISENYIYCIKAVTAKHSRLRLLFCLILQRV